MKINKIDKDLLNRVYDNIIIINANKLESDFHDIVFDLVDEFLKKYEETNYPLIILNSSQNIDAVKIGALLDICIWSSKDNGEKQSIETTKWINSENERKIEVALNISNIFPINDFNELQCRLYDIMVKYPKLKYLCEFWIDGINNAFERDKRIRLEKWSNITILQKLYEKYIKRY